MRPIKFRAWDRNIGKIFELGTIQDILETQAGMDDESWLLDEDSHYLMQFTGLLDKNGKEIYEGDVLEYERQQTDEAKMQPMREVVGFAGGRFTNLPWGEEIAEIIGNIYENPELLKP